MYYEEKIFMNKNIQKLINDSSAPRSKILEYFNKKMCYFIKVATKILNKGLYMW